MILSAAALHLSAGGSVLLRTCAMEAEKVEEFRI